MAQRKGAKPWNKGQLILHPCNGCQIQIRKWQTYCSHECYVQAKPKPKILKKHCLICKKLFAVRLSYKRQKTCSDKCGRALAIQSRQGEKHWNWKNGKTPIDKAERMLFRRTIQSKVLERDDYTCQLCFQRGVDLQVDHIQPWAEYVEGRFDMNNCRTLCAKCHYKITFGRPMPENISGWGHNILKGRVTK